MRVPGKWVLCGEHSVLKGGTAVALPHPEFALEWSFEPGGQGLRVEPEASRRPVSDILRAVEDALPESSIRWPEGEIRIESTIPFGAGLGSSAAFCVAATRWIQEPLRLADEIVFEFARQLENRFHGKSSGMDIAACLHGEPIGYSMQDGPRPLGIRLLPKFSFHDTGLRARTLDCVMKVEDFREAKPFESMKWDESMAKASRRAMAGLAAGDLREIADAMNQAHGCFEAWGLVPAEVAAQRERLIAEGALGAKLTGAGGGGFLVALWN